LHRAVEFLEDGDRIKVTVRFRGRELTHPELGRRMLERFADQVKEHGVIERPPILEGKSMFITLASTHKPKMEAATAAPAAAPDAAAATPAATAPTPEAAPAPTPRPAAAPVEPTAGEPAVSGG
jgi:translation initiation factor IF-3